MGVRGVALDNGDKVISLAILRHVEAAGEERAAYLKRASAVRRGLNDDAAEESLPDAGSRSRRGRRGDRTLGEQRYVGICRRRNSSC